MGGASSVMTPRESSIYAVSEQGRNSIQRDTITVCKPRGKAAISPEEFYRETIPQIVDKYKHCTNGSTLCSATVTPGGDEPTIDVCNLGDSKAILVVKYLSEDGRSVHYASFGITEDTAVYKKRFQKILAQEGDAGDLLMTKSATGGNYTLVGSVGDNSGRQANMRISEPDYFRHRISHIVKNIIPMDRIKNVDLVVATKGMFRFPEGEKLFLDYEIKVNGPFMEPFSIIPKTRKPEMRFSLSEWRREFDRQAIQDDGERNFAQFLSQKSFEAGSTYNTSIGTMSLMEHREWLVREPIAISVYDGHGKAKRFGDYYHSGGPFNNDGGEIVSASVAADVFEAMRGKFLENIGNISKNLETILQTKIPTSRPQSQEGARVTNNSKGNDIPDFS